MNLFDPHTAPRVFALPPGADFPRLLVQGLLDRMGHKPPEALAQVELYVNTRRMQRRVRAILAEEGARLLPRLRLITDIGTAVAISGLPPPVPPLRRRLELMQLVSRLLQHNPDLAPEWAAYDLADSLARLMDEMQSEGVSPEVLERLDVSAHSGHWQRSLAFIRLVQRYFGPEATSRPDANALQRLAVERLTALWSAAPPGNPVIVAGSTGSRGMTARLMEAVARLPQGALVMPGFDFHMPASVWEGLGDALTAEDHPQYRFRTLLDRVGMGPRDVRRWVDAEAPCPARNRLVSLALRPAPVTDQWMTEGPRLTDLALATEAVTLIEAASPRAEALAIALRLRRAAEDGVKAALITPDRGLTRQVAALLDRWRIVPDDSAGRPLALSAPGRFLRHVARLFGRRLTVEALVTLLKHPLTHSGAGRGDHLRHTRDLELRLRRKGPAFPDAASLLAWASTRDAGAQDWAEWLASCLEGIADKGTEPLAVHAQRHLALAERLAAGPDTAGSGVLWLKEAGEEARKAADELLREAAHGGAHTPGQYAAFMDSLLQGREVREAVQAHPGIMIWGTLEARVQGAELVILGGLNEGSWPQIPPPDPWLNRQMRLEAGLLLPERQIGLAAHDFQQAVAAPEVVLSRALRDAEAATVPSRWLNRLTNLLQGLPEQGGTAALEAMRARGRAWLGTAEALENDFMPADPAPRPAPCPPVAARPRELSVTAIERLIRDPYAIYARHVLGLRRLDPLHPQPDALLRGQVLHHVIERFVLERVDGESPEAARTRLATLADAVLSEQVPWPAARRLWAARLGRVAAWFVGCEARREGRPLQTEKGGHLDLPDLGFRLKARPDRIDELPGGALEILDYKTGAPPTQAQQKHFAKQLLLEAVMAEHGAFTGAPREVARVVYVGLGTNPREAVSEVTPEINAANLAGLHRLVARYLAPDQGFAARRAPLSVLIEGDFDHLARHGEWSVSDPPVNLPVGEP